ncbi:MAG: hypothetical protein ACIAQ0_00060 [Phycisphaerales bacterium JB058]
MNSASHRRAIGRGARLCFGLLAAVIACGCYSKVVDAKGIGADSTELRKNHEFGSENPVQDVLTRDKRR